MRTLLAETIAWCRVHASFANPKQSLRTLALRPSNLHRTANEWGHFDYDWGTFEENQTLVATLAATRAELLRAENSSTNILPPDLAGGRLLVACPEDSDVCGLSMTESDGFIDDLDVPAWDTWICYVQEPSTLEPELVREAQKKHHAFHNGLLQKAWEQSHLFPRRRSKSMYAEWSPPEWKPPDSLTCILCWIPPEFVALVQEGILVNPVGCLFWASEYKQMHYDTEFMRQLEAAGLLC